MPTPSTHQHLKKELTRIALVGTQRAEMNDTIQQQLHSIGINAKTNEETLLSGLAILSRMQKAGFRPASLPSLPPAAPFKEHQKVCSPKSIKHLYMIVDGAFEAALPEFLQHLANNGKCLPPEILPDLLDQALSSPELWAKLRQSLGTRGEWLIQQNPNWQRLIQNSPPSDWEHASSDERLIILAQTRSQNPRQALDMLRNTWENEGINQRVRFLKILENQLSEDDEEFLESLLDHRRKEIRKAAIQLLAKLPDSALSQRMFNRLTALITPKKRLLKKDKLEIHLPDRLDDSMIRDGIDPRIQWFKGGVKASRLGQMVALVPPSMWCEYFGSPPKDMVQLFVRSNWGELLIQAAIEATILHQDQDWAEALLTFRMESQERQRWQALNVNKLMDGLPTDIFNRVAIKGMQQTKGLLEENSPITYLLKNSNAPWDDDLALLVVKNLQDWLAGESSRYWNGWHYRSILKKAAYNCDPFLHDRLTADWPEESRIWSSWEREIEEFLSTLFFRKKMIAGLRV